jgi:hypothetical protein
MNLKKPNPIGFRQHTEYDGIFACHFWLVRLSRFTPSGGSSPHLPKRSRDVESRGRQLNQALPQTTSLQEITARDANYVFDFGASLGASRLALGFHDTWFQSG